MLTADHSWGFYHSLNGMALRHGWSAAAILAVLNAESGMYAHANNGVAFGLNQMNADNLRDAGWSGSPAQYLALSAEAQLPYVEAYFAKHHLPPMATVADFYVANFLPAYLANAHDPSFRFPDKWYAANARTFDPTHKGWIQVSDLTDYIARASKTDRFREALGRLGSAGAGDVVGMLAVTAAAGAIGWLAWRWRDQREAA